MHLIGDIYVSEILRKPVLDRAGEETGRIVDFTISLGELFPRVSGIVVARKGERFIIPWEHITLFNRKVISTDLPASKLVAATLGETQMLACKHLLDKQIVDINGAKVVRVNDLKLGEVKGSLCLMAADVGIAGLFRRLGIKKRWERVARLLGFKQTTNLISWNFLQPLGSKFSALTLTIPRQQLSNLHPSDIAQIISEVPQKDRHTIFLSLDVETAAEAIHELEPAIQSTIIAAMDSEDAADILEAMPPDEAADLMADLPDEKARAILRLMEKDEADDVQELLEHEEDTAGGLMTNEYLSFRPEMTVAESLTEYRLEAPNVDAASAYVLYVMDEDEKLLGEVTLKDLILASPKKTMSEIMNTDFKYVSPGVDEKEAAEIISKYNLLALPVLDDDRGMLGIVTVDDVLDLVLPPQSRRRRHRIG